MSRTVTAEVSGRPPLLPEKTGGQAKVSDPTPRKAETWREFGQAIDYARRDAQLSIKEFAGALGRDEGQVRAWIEARERPQIETVLAVPRFKSAVIVGLAASSADLQIETLIRRRA